ncbi:MAG: ASCH domain-containing protein [Filifactoraceae bacterium]
MKSDKLWAAFIDKHPEHKSESYTSWSYGSEVSDQLAELTLNGFKTATASIYQAYLECKEQLPKEGSYGVLLNSAEDALCILQTTKVYLCPFDQVSSQHAYKEGEGDKSLSYWKKVHRAFFSEELLTYNINFNEDMLVVCEEFKVVFTKEEASLN